MLTLAGFSIIFDITCITLFAKHKLWPRTFLILNGLSTAIWIAVFVAKHIFVPYDIRKPETFGSIVVIILLWVLRLRDEDLYLT